MAPFPMQRIFAHWILDTVTGFNGNDMPGIPHMRDSAMLTPNLVPHIDDHMGGPLIFDPVCMTILWAPILEPHALEYMVPHVD